jgi:hypothetical protein
MSSSPTISLILDVWNKCRADLDTWFMQNLAHPYPSLRVLREFSMKWGVDLRQLRTYLTNRRTRFPISQYPQFRGQWPAVAPRSGRG